ncbi:MAG: B12-binding domain-containing radical SAM protein [Caldilineales bacterium]|nr:B12-binding domain-containing radical SAM protein [Caldilineales bacterium]
MDILLTHGYFLFEDEHERQVMKPYPPLGLLYVSSHLKAAGFDVDVFDSTFCDWDAFGQYLEIARPPLVGIYTNLMTKQNVLRMVSMCKAVDARVILGGPEPPHYAEHYLAHGADIVVIGEGELTLAELIPHMQQHGLSGLEGVAGIAFRNEDGQIVRTRTREQIADLSAQPWPDRAAIDLERYLETWQKYHGVRSISLITARGCPYTCTWCSHSVFGETHRRRTPQDVADEVAFLAETYRPDQLWYADDVFTIQPRWTKQYAEELAQRGLRLPFECISRADRLNEELVDVLAEMGCHRLWIGSESGSQRILDAMKRKADVADVQAKSKMLREAGIQVGMFIMLGYDGEDVSDLEATVEHLKRSNPDVFLTTVAYPIKGTKYYEAVSDRVYAGKGWQERTDRDLGVSGRYSSQFYDHATRWMVNEVNLHKVRQNGGGGIQQQGRLWLNARRGRLGMRLTQRQRENNGEEAGAGRGWATDERAVEGW